MDRCKSCQNILPRTVDRCPVCGFDNRVPEPVPDPHEHSGHAPTDFLGAIGKKRTPEEKAPRITSPRSKNAPTRVGHDGATPLYDDPAPGERHKRSSDYELPDLGEETRTVAALSARISSDIRLGRRPHHLAAAVAAAVIAVAALAAGTAFGLKRTASPDQIAMTSIDIPVGEATVPLQVTGPVARFAPGAVVSIVERSACVAPVSAIGTVVEGGVVIASSFEVARADRPQIVSDAAETKGDVLGTSNPVNLTVVRPDDPIGDRLRIAIDARIRTGTGVAYATVADGQVTLHPATVDRVEAPAGELVSYTVARTLADGSTASVDLAPGTPIVNIDGDVVGMADVDGSIIAAARLSEPVAELRTAPLFPAPRCS